MGGVMKKHLMFLPWLILLPLMIAVLWGCGDTAVLTALQAAQAKLHVHFYVSGAVGPSQGTRTPCYWKDGVLTPLAVGSINSFGIANGPIWDSLGNIYFIGEVGVSSSSYSACYWKNGTPVILPTRLGDTSAFTGGAARDSAGNLFIAGTLTGVDQVPC
jgi:hypothetical protein